MGCSSIHPYLRRNFNWLVLSAKQVRHSMDSEFRELTVRERGLLEKLLTAAIYGRDELRTQLVHCKAKQIESDGTLELQCQDGTPALGKFAPVAEGAYKDADGADIAVILHLGKGGFMSMLEIIKYNG